MRIEIKTPEHLPRVGELLSSPTIDILLLADDNIVIPSDDIINYTPLMTVSIEQNKCLKKLVDFHRIGTVVIDQSNNIWNITRTQGMFIYRNDIPLAKECGGNDEPIEDILNELSIKYRPLMRVTIENNASLWHMQGLCSDIPDIKIKSIRTYEQFHEMEK